MSEAPRGQLVYDGVISRRRGDAKEVAFAPEAKRKEKLRPLRVARMLALAHECEALIAARVVADRAELAGVLGFTRARVTQLMDLTLLAPDIQEEILIAEVDLKLQENVRQNWPFFRDRRIDAFGDITKRAIL